MCIQYSQSKSHFNYFAQWKISFFFYCLLNNYQFSLCSSYCEHTSDESLNTVVANIESMRTKTRNTLLNMVSAHQVKKMRIRTRICIYLHSACECPGDSILVWTRVYQVLIWLRKKIKSNIFLILANVRKAYHSEINISFLHV